MLSEGTELVCVSCNQTQRKFEQFIDNNRGPRNRSRKEAATTKHARLNINGDQEAANKKKTYPNEAEEQLNPAVFFFGLLLFLTMSSLRSSLVEIKGRKTRHGNIHGQYTTPKAGFDFSRSAADGLWLTKELSKVVKQSRSTLPPPRCSYAKFLSAGLNTCLLNHNNFSRHTRTLDRY